MSCVNLDAGEATVRQRASTIDKLRDDMINIGIGHSRWHPENEIPDQCCSQSIADIKRNLTWRNRLPKDAPFTCTSRGLTAGVAYLSDCGRAVMLAGLCVLLPHLQCLMLIFSILASS